MSTSLSVAAVGRDNNFNLLRLAAAWAVLVSHSFVIVTGDPKSEPLSGSLGVTPGSLAVDIFFVTSGLLITASLLTRTSLLRFAVARLLRIYPAILLMVMSSALILGLFFANMPFSDFVQHEQTHQYLWRNSTLVNGTTGALPAVFADVPLRGVLHGSLWTLPFELRMYALLSGVWALALVLGRYRERGFAVAALALALTTMGLHLHTILTGGAVDQRWRLTCMFFAGAAMYMYRHRVHLNNRAFAGAAAALLLSTLDRTAFTLTYHAVVGYLVIWIAYIPHGFVRRFNAMGDYSYGTYIWAFPVQQALISLQPSLDIGVHILQSTVVTLLFAALSWHFVERPALAIARR